LAQSLRELASDAQQLRADVNGDVHELLRQQLLAAELPLALGCLFPELKPMRDLLASARQSFTESLLAVLDGKGGPHGRLLPVLGPLVACWTRARWLGEREKGGAWSKEAEAQYRWLVLHALRLAATDGRFLATNVHARYDRSGFWPMLAESVELAGDKADRIALPRRRRASRSQSQDRSSSIAEAGLHSGMGRTIHFSHRLGQIRRTAGYRVRQRSADA
jgi:hypothetical protein